MIPVVWKEYTCNVSGGTFKVVECEQCKQRYVYRMIRAVQGQGNSLYFLDNAGAENRAKTAATDALQKQLENDCDAVPCIKCGWYQVDMTAKLRGEHRVGLFYLGVGLYFFAAIAAALAWIMYMAADAPGAATGGLNLFVFCAIFGTVAMLGRKFLAARWDPNGAPQAERLYIAEGKAQTLEEFEKWLGEQGSETERPIEK